jgi:hypothetical protein
MAEVLVKKGMKNRFRLKESDFLNIPSITSVVLGIQPQFYEAYVYLIKDVITGMMYIGVHKKNDKTYWTSMKHKEGLKVLQGSETRIEYKILAYGSYGVMKNLEADLITKHDAVRNPLFWNQMAGMYHKESLRMDVVKQIVSDIESGVYPVNEELVSDLIKLPTWQVRENEYEPDHLKKIKGKIRDAGGSHEKTNPIIILNNRLNSEMYDEVDLRIDGAHTLEAERTEGCIFGKTIRLPEEVHKDLSHSEVERIASLLNKDPEILKLPNSNKTLANILFGTWLRSRAIIDCDDNIEFLKEQGKSSQERKKIFKIVEELKKAHEYEADRNVVLIDYKEADKKLLKNEEAIRETSASIVTSQSTSSLRWDRACEKIQDDELERTHLVYIVYHSSFTAAEEDWDTEKDKLVKRLNKWLVPAGYTYEIVVMPHEREKVQL